jgi:flagellar protein FlaI
MFQGMSSGHPSLSTFHAGSVESVIKRLTSPPIELAPSLIESLDVISVMIHARERGKSSRRVKEIAEIISVDPKTQEVKTNVVFRWDPATDNYVRVNNSVKVEKLAIARGSTYEDAMKDIEDRRRVIQWMVRSQKKDFIEAAKIINMYIKEKQKLFQLMGQSPGMAGSSYTNTQIPISVPYQAQQAAPPDAREAQTGEKKKRSSILDLLGMKMIKEK